MPKIHVSRPATYEGKSPAPVVESAHAESAIVAVTVTQSRAGVEEIKEPAPKPTVVRRRQRSTEEK